MPKKIDIDLISQALRNNKVEDAKIPAILRDCEKIAQENKPEPAPKESQDELQYYALAVVPSDKIDTYSSLLDGISCYVFQGGNASNPVEIINISAKAAVRHNEMRAAKSKKGRKAKGLPVDSIHTAIADIKSKALWYDEKEYDAGTYIKPIKKVPFTLVCGTDEQFSVQLENMQQEPEEEQN